MGVDHNERLHADTGETERGVSSVTITRVAPGWVCTPAGVQRDASRIAGALRERGVAAGDRVILKADNSVAYVATVLALAHLDTSLVLLDHRQTDEESRRAAAVTRARWAIVQRGRALDGVPHVLAIEELATGPTATGPLDLGPWRRRDDALVTWSSGSTGDPRGVVRSGRALLGNIDASGARMAYRPDDVLLPLLPFSHQYGLSLLLLSWMVGSSLVVAPYGQLDQALRIAGRAGATVVDATPATYHTLLGVTERRPELLAGLHRVRMWCVGGSPLDPSLADRFAKEFGLPLLDGYGSTEVGNIALATPENAVGCGQPLDGVHVEIVGADGRPVPAGRTGEIWVRSPGLMEGYLTEDGTVVPPDTACYRTHDLGYRDAGGNLSIVGRKFAVHRLGHTLYPEALERRAEACGRPVKVVAIEDQRRGCQLVFFVADPALGAVRDWRRAICALLPSYEQPNHVLVVPDFPLNRSGKPDAARLRQLATESFSAPLVRTIAPVAASGSRNGEARIAPADRVRAVAAVLDLLRTDPGPVVEVLTEISIHKAVQLEIEAATRTLGGAVAEVLTHRPEHLSRMAVFMPSNVLLYSYVLYLLVPSLFVDRLVFRPSTQVAGQMRRLHEVLAPVHGLPIELAALSQRQFVDGPAAEADVIVFTGTYANAEQIRARLPAERLFLFFGQGINPFVVAPEADLDLASEHAVRIRLLNSGQDCFGPDVYFVHQSGLEPFVDGVVRQLTALRYGEYRDCEADYGALCYDGALETAADYLRAHRSHIVHGGRIDFRARKVEPTLLVRGFTDQLTITELFSPILDVVGYDDPDQLCARLTSPFFNERAMGAMVYGRAPGLVEQLAKRHTVTLNATLLDAEDGNRPFGGRGMRANYASRRGRRVAEPLLISKAVADHRGSGP